MGSVIFTDGRLLCEGAKAILLDTGEHPVAQGEPFDVLANTNDFASEFVAEHEQKLRPVNGPRLPLPELDIHGVQARRTHSDENVAGPWRRRRDIR
jgi:hypothetical protein